MVGTFFVLENVGFSKISFPEKGFYKKNVMSILFIS